MKKNNTLYLAYVSEYNKEVDVLDVDNEVFKFYEEEPTKEELDEYNFDKCTKVNVEYEDDKITRIVFKMLDLNDEITSYIESRLSIETLQQILNITKEMKWNDFDIYLNVLKELDENILFLPRHEFYVLDF